MKNEKGLPLDELVSAKSESIENARHFASAEIMSRTMAHFIFPESLPTPVAIVDMNQEPVGFYVSHNKAVTNALDVQIRDAFFDKERVFDIMEKLKKANIVVYNEVPSDIKNQVLYDLIQTEPADQFVNFARLGYRL